MLGHQSLRKVWADSSHNLRLLAQVKNDAQAIQPARSAAPAEDASSMSRDGLPIREETPGRDDCS